MVGRQTPILALIVPLILVGMVDGGRGVRQAWPAAVVGGFTFALGQFVCSNYVSVELTDIVASLLVRRLDRAAAAGLEAVRAAARRGPAAAARSPRSPAPRSPTRPTSARSSARRATATTPPAEILAAFAPYLIIIAVFSLAQLGPDQGLPRRAHQGVRLAGPEHQNAGRRSRRPRSTFKFNWANAAGTLLLVSGLLTMLVLRFSPRRAFAHARADAGRARSGRRSPSPSVLALAYVMNLSGQTITLGQWIAGASGLLPFLSSLIGWLGVAVTGSDTSSNSLFGTLQVAAAQKAGYSPDAARRGELLGRRARQDDLAAEPRDRRRRGRTGRP